MKIKLPIKKPNLKKYSLRKLSLQRFAKAVKSFVAWLKGMIMRPAVLFWMLIILILGLNFVFDRYYLRYDLTDTKKYSVSGATERIVSELSEPVTMEVFYSNNLPVSIALVKQNTLDLLAEYEQYSAGNLRVEIVDPNAADFETRALGRGIQQVQFSDLSEDKYEIAQGFIGIAVVQGEDYEAIPVAATVEDLEYRLTSAITKLEKDEKPVIAFLTGHEQKTSATDFTVFTDFISATYEVEDVDLTEIEELTPEDYQVVIIAAPRLNLGEQGQYKLDQYLMRGGKLILLGDKYTLQQQAPIMSAEQTDYYEFFNHYGFNVQKRIVLDESYTPLTSGFSRIAYPYWVLVSGDNVNRNIPPLTNLEGITLMWPNALKAMTEDNELNFEPLLSSTNSAWSETMDVISIDFRDFVAQDQQKFILAAYISGKIESKFADGELPKNADQDTFVAETDDLQIVAVADSDFATDDFVNVNSQGAFFLANIIEWLGGDEGLTEIRSKAVDVRPLESVDVNTANIYKGIVVATPALITVLVGVAFIYRRNRKASLI